MSVPPPDPSTSPPPPDSDYQNAIATFCTHASQTRAALQQMSGDQGTQHDVSDLVEIEQDFHAAFADLFAAHEQQFGASLNGSQPIDAAFTVDASIAMLATQAQQDGKITLLSTDAIFQQFTEVAHGCAAQGAPMQ